MSFELLLTLSVGIAGGLLFFTLRVPGGALLGSLVAASLLHIQFVQLPPTPSVVRISAQIAIGTMVGASIRREPLIRLIDRGPAILVSVTLVLSVALFSGVLLVALTPFDLSTMLLATIPGGAADITAAALDLGGDAAVVGAFQIIRQTLVFGVIAVFGTRLARLRDSQPDPDSDTDQSNDPDTDKK